MAKSVGVGRFGPAILTAVAAILPFMPQVALAQSSSISAWEAAEFRAWSFIPYWISNSQIAAFGPNGAYDHLSDVVYHAGAHPRADGSLEITSTRSTHLATIKAQQAQFGFRYHTSLYDAAENPGESAAAAVERVWNAITSNPTTRATFVNNVKTFLTNNNMTGVNLDWERPNTVTEWANYTQVAKDMQAAFPEAWEVSVDDYGFADSRWDDSPVFDARTYDQIGMMGYHYPANNGTNLDQQSFADGKKALTAQGAEKAFKDSQIIIGMGTWGTDGPGTVGLKDIVAVNPNLPGDATSFTGTVNGLTGTWNIVSRYEVRDNVQLALDRGMPGVMWWALSYDATNKMSLARVAQHYAMFKRGVPDLTLDGKVDAADASALADNMGTTLVETGTTTAAQMEAFYMGGNWEKGDRDGNGYVNQADADWLAGRYGALNVALPDRLAYTGSFEKFSNALGVDGRWQARRNHTNQLMETGNFTQHDPGTLSYSGTGAGAGKYSTGSVSIRNQNAAEDVDNVNEDVRQMRGQLSTPLDLGQDQETYLTFLVRQNSAPLLPGQVASPNRTLSLEMLNSAGQSQFDFTLFGQQTDFGIRSQADAAGQDVTADGFAADTTYLFVAKISGNGQEANTMQASLFAPGAAVGNFTDPNFAWTLTAEGGAGFNPLVTQLQFTSTFEGNFTVSNVWAGEAGDFFAAPAPGDFNADGVVDSADLERWSAGMGMTDGATHWHGDANGDQMVDGADFLVWQQRLGSVTPAAANAVGVPEPGTACLMLLAASALVRRRVLVW
ncbi:MAG: hypothetical protein H0T51_23200 [Pirellulales bacterium]|nr:hypothetical protein [Pirellulales bacterium]